MFIILTGCWDRRPIGDLDVVKLIFFDRAEGGADDIQGLFYRPAFQVNKTIYADILYEKGRTFYEIRDKIQHHEGSRLVYGHVEIIMIGNDLAEQGISGIITQLDSDTLFNRKSSVVILESDFNDLLKFVSPEQLRTAMYLRDVVVQGNSISYNSKPSVTKVISTLLNKGRELSLPVTSLDHERGKLKIVGLGVFKDDKMVGMINADKTKIYLLLVDDVQEQPYHFSHIKTEKTALKEVDFTIVKNDIQTKINIIDDIPHIDLSGKFTINIEHFVLREGVLDNYNIFNEKEIKILKRSISEILEKEITDLIGNLQKEYNSDIIGLGEKVRISNIEYFNRHEWSEVFPLAEISVKTDIKFLKIGHDVEQLK
jgi:Ger(x)C family germination protein